uniref:PiggyBac transposable element-derived protein domain-containing protein n=1 Tax=Plectus sambesii TaxID=2011161 RepID=A0A914WRT8_9BILA
MAEKLELSFDRLLLESEDKGNEEQDGVDGMALSSDEDDITDDDEENSNQDYEWEETVESFNRWNFMDVSGLNYGLLEDCKEPNDFYELFVNEDIFELIVQETNRYAMAKDPDWSDTTTFKLKKFFALIMQMGIVKMPELRNYWSSDLIFGGNPIGAAVMPRARFEQLLTNTHLPDNDSADKIDRLYKISAFMQVFVWRCKLLCQPCKEVCIDESLIPFRGRIIFRQYIPNKRHRYGIKVFKLCSQGGYTFNMAIYAGKQAQKRVGSVAEDVVMKLLDELLDSGRTLYTDNWYTGVPLAKMLLSKETDLVGTIRRNRRGLPK